MRRLVLASVCSFLVGALTGTGIAQRAPEREVAYALPQPAEWVAFTADFAMTWPDGRNAHGRFYRASDGSTRSETIPNRPDKKMLDVYIENFRLESSFQNRGGNVWYTEKLNLARKTPTPWSSRARGLAPYQHKLGVMKGQDGSLRAEHGVDAYILSNANGSTLLMAPSLNFFPLVNASVSGLHRRFFNVELVQTDAAMFEPPPGSPVEPRPR